MNILTPFSPSGLTVAPPISSHNMNPTPAYIEVMPKGQTPIQALTYLTARNMLLNEIGKPSETLVGHVFFTVFDAIIETSPVKATGRLIDKAIQWVLGITEGPQLRETKRDQHEEAGDEIYRKCGTNKLIVYSKEKDSDGTALMNDILKLTLSLGRECKLNEEQFKCIDKHFNPYFSENAALLDTYEANNTIDTTRWSYSTTSALTPLSWTILCEGQYNLSLPFIKQLENKLNDLIQCEKNTYEQKVLSVGVGISVVVVLTCVGIICILRARSTSDDSSDSSESTYLLSTPSEGNDQTNHRGSNHYGSDLKDRAITDRDSFFEDDTIIYIPPLPSNKLPSNIGPYSPYPTTFSPNQMEHQLSS